MFVDATRYMKVQDEDLDKSFAQQEETKFGKASFESFTLEPSHLPYETPWYKKKRYVVPAIVTTVVIFAIAGVFGVLVLSDGLFIDGASYAPSNSTIVGVDSASNSTLGD